jgi:hypothetical protein
LDALDPLVGVVGAGGAEDGNSLGAVHACIIS